MTHRLACVAALCALASTASCVHIFRGVRADDLTNLPGTLAAESTFVRGPVRAHLADGSTVIFRGGAWVSRTHVSGSGIGYPMLSDVGLARTALPTDSVVGLESFREVIRRGPTIATSLAATATGGFGLLAAAFAAFGSCPTVYADSGGVPVLEAEGFSYAISPLFEHRDVDGLRVRPDADGVIRLELRNEALETHYINHIELLGVRHRAGTRILPDQGSQPTAISGVRPLTRARDRSGRDVRAVVGVADGRLFVSAASTIRAARVGDLDDWIDIEADGLPPGDSVAVVLRLRNSLLNTVLLYEGMLGGSDAMEWESSKLQHIASVVDLSRWYVGTMGLRVETTVDGAEGATIHVARLNDVGPIAFRDVAVILPRRRDARTIRVRLRFVADNWRIDQITVAGEVTRPTTHLLPVARVIAPVSERTHMPATDTAALRTLGQIDDAYLETEPGQRMILEFPAPVPTRPTAAPDDSTTTYLLAWQGWYQEWIRGAWIARPAHTDPFVPGDAAVLTALRRWRVRAPSMEAAFYASKIPVR